MTVRIFQVQRFPRSEINPVFCAAFIKGQASGRRGSIQRDRNLRETGIARVIRCRGGKDNAVSVKPGFIRFDSSVYGKHSFLLKEAFPQQLFRSSVCRIINTDRQFPDGGKAALFSR